MAPRVFAQRQLARAAALGLGASGPEDLELVAADETSRVWRDRLEAVLRQDSVP
ncbi:MAG: hypothetical protein IH608_08115, partial [Proteobacteria bacterium]|nr:hypothetical protein [Pseudomonadota bacterium]